MERLDSETILERTEELKASLVKYCCDVDRLKHLMEFLMKNVPYTRLDWSFLQALERNAQEVNAIVQEYIHELEFANMALVYAPPEMFRKSDSRSPNFHDYDDIL